MALINKALYDAVRKANVPDDDAAKAAESLAAYDSRLQRLEVMVAAILAMNIAILVKLFGH